MIIDAGLCRIRPWESRDLERLPAIANDIGVARYLRHRFPHPYTNEDAAVWLALVAAKPDGSRFAIEVDGVLAGGIAIEPFTQEHADVGDLGYWLGREYWGRGIATSLVRALVRHGFETLNLRRLEAPVMAANVASARVLEKAGFVCEATLSQYYVDREGTLHDGIMYRMIRSEYQDAIRSRKQR